MSNEHSMLLWSFEGGGLFLWVLWWEGSTRIFDQHFYFVMNFVGKDCVLDFSLG